VFENSSIWPFSRNAFSDEGFTAASVVCGGFNEPSVLTLQSVGWMTSSMAQVSISLEKEVTPEQYCLYPGAAPSVSGNGG
jgi:hypothetical protein